MVEKELLLIRQSITLQSLNVRQSAEETGLLIAAEEKLGLGACSIAENWAYFPYLAENSSRNSLHFRLTGGESGIRTHDTVSRIHAFQACAFSHSAISPADDLRFVDCLRRSGRVS